MKIGFDIHGVFDSFDVFPQLAKHLLNIPGIEIHIITGLTQTKAHKSIGHLVNLSHGSVKYFSIVDHLIEQGEYIEWRGDLPFADAKKWDRAKADYCQRENITILFDDSPIYAQHFDNIDTVYCQVHNPNRSHFHTRDNLSKRE